MKQVKEEIKEDIYKVGKQKSNEKNIPEEKKEKDMID